MITEAEPKAPAASTAAIGDELIKRAEPEELLRTGEGVDRTDYTAPMIQTPPPVAEEDAEKKNTGGTTARRTQVELLDYPSTIDQAEKHPTTIRVQAPQLRVFDLNNEVGLSELNKLLEGLHPPTAPVIVLHDMDTRYSESTGSWKALVRYSKVRYVKLTPIPE